MPDSINRQWVLARRPQGMVSADDFEYREVAVPEPADAEALVRTLYLSFDPAQRVWMDARPSYIPPVQIDAVMRANSVGQVVKSNDPNFAAGDLVHGVGGWQDYFIGRGGDDFTGLSKLPKDAPPTLALSVLGITGLTAYFGMLEIGKPQAGQVALISGAAGATGSIAGQIARIHGCRTIGIAGGADKCRWLCEEAGFDAAIDYKNENVNARIGELCPDGINLYFENVGGPVLEAALGHLAMHARVVFCGSLSGYNAKTVMPGPRNLANLVVKRARIEGFIVLDYADRFPAAQKQLQGWLQARKLIYQEDIQEGFEHIPDTLFRLFAGRNIGKQLLKLSDPV